MRVRSTGEDHHEYERYYVYIKIFEIEETHHINRDMREHIDSCLKQSEKCAAYLEQSTEHFEDVANITTNGASVILQGKKNGN